MATRNIMRLSGGQQQRVAIARALACDVDILFADEPTGNLDEDTAEGIIDTFRGLAHEQDKCVVVVTHSQRLAAVRPRPHPAQGQADGRGETTLTTHPPGTGRGRCRRGRSRRCP
ncbi:hypothetical protein SHIRM173S_12226 [Streptomyces hirsutus]